LESWFSERFYDLALDRIRFQGSADQAVDTKYLDRAKEGFVEFLQKWHEVRVELEGRERGPGQLQDPVGEYLLPICKKIVRFSGGDPALAEEVARSFMPGSALFLLEFFALLGKEDIIWKFQRKLLKLDPKRVIDLASLPVVVVRLWTHQQEAIDAWERNDHQGIIEMATATGKTVVGLAAIERLRKVGGGTVRILAHSRALLDQWRREAIHKLGLVANPSESHETPLRTDKVVIRFGTIQSAHRRPNKYACDLLIVDEVHHTAAYRFRNALKAPSNWKMGLSAVVEGRERNTILERRLGPIVYHLDLKEALRLGILPRFEWRVYPVNLSVDEEREFKKISRQIATLVLRLKEDKETISKLGETDHELETLQDFVVLMERARYRGRRLPEDWLNLRDLVLKRRWLIHRSKPRVQEVLFLTERVAKSHKCVIFAMDIETCETISKELNDRGISALPVHSKLRSSEVSRRIELFRTVSAGVLVAPRMLDEGIDIPDADIGINAAASKSRLQLVQRIGRILRNVPDKRPVFHHFVAIPDRSSIVQMEDAWAALDDLAWVQWTALRLGVSADVVPLEEAREAFESMRRAEEEVAATLQRRQRVDLPSTGTIRLPELVSAMSNDVRQRLVAEIQKRGMTDPISDKDWLDLVRSAYSSREGTPLSLESHWWILVAAGRDPSRLAALLQGKSL
jgi:superfamily II DNA or RNA helicase